MTNRQYLRLLRPGHWVKNVFVLLPVIFAMKIAEPFSWLMAGVAAGAFCLISSSIYIINDIHDRERDSLHPAKKHRPIASGVISIRLAGIVSNILLLLALTCSVASGSIIGQKASLLLSVTLLGYFCLQIVYTFFLKQKMLVDVICIAIGFVLRAMAGAVAIEVEISPWLFVCTFTICLFMGFCKRANEIVSLDDVQTSAHHRKTLSAYTPELLTHLITLSASVAVISFILYSLNSSTTSRFGSEYLVYTLPLFVYGIFRFAMLSMNATYSDPTDILLKDRPMQATALLWFASTVAIILWGRHLADYIK